MSCESFEPLIALYVEGDLPGGDIASVQKHLDVCAGCRDLLDELEASQQALKQLRAKPVDAALLAAVRSVVLGHCTKAAACGAAIPGGEPAFLPALHQAQSPHGRGLAGRIAGPTLLAAAMILFALLRPTPAIAPGPAAVVRITAAVPSPPPPPPKLRAIRRPKRKAAEPLVVKMYTDDPNIVIIWLVDQTGD